MSGVVTYGFGAIVDQGFIVCYGFDNDPIPPHEFQLAFKLFIKQNCNFIVER